MDRHFFTRRRFIEGLGLPPRPARRTPRVRRGRSALEQRSATARHGVRSHDRRAHGQFHGQIARRDGREWFAASADAALARRRHGHDPRPQRARRAHTSIHWHGLVLPANMDGVPGLSFHGIAPGETFTYRFRCGRAARTGITRTPRFQEQTGLYGALIIEPREPEPFAYDREHVVLLSDWTDRDPLALYRLLKRHSDYFNYQKRTLGDYVRDVSATASQRRAPSVANGRACACKPSDLADVSGAAYTYLMNGAHAGRQLDGSLSRPASACACGSSTARRCRRSTCAFPGLQMTVVAADGQDVHPVTVDEFRIATAETFDVLVMPTRRRRVHDLRAIARSHRLRARHARRRAKGSRRRCPSSTVSCI